MFLFLAVASMLGYAIQGTFLVPYARKMDGLSLAVYRNLSLGVSMLPLLFFSSGNVFLEFFRVWNLLIPAAVFGALSLWCTFLSNRSLPVGIASALSNIRVVFILLLSFFFIQEDISSTQGAWIVLLLLSVIFVSLQKNHFPHLDGKVLKGSLFALLGGTFGSITVFLSGFAAQKADPFVVSYFWEVLIGILALGFVGVRLLLGKASVHKISWREFGKIGLISSWTAVGTGAFMLAVNYGPIGIVGAVGASSLLFSTLFSHFFYREKLKTAHWIGLFLIILAIIGLRLAEG